MNPREAARLVDYGVTEVVVLDADGLEVARGVARSVDMVPTMTVEQADGTVVAVPLSQVQPIR